MLILDICKMYVYIIFMRKKTNRDKLLEHGLRVIHEQGLAGASMRDIAAAAGVPLGSFTNHFSNKTAFALEIIDTYRQSSHAMIDATLLNRQLPPLQRLGDFIDVSCDYLAEDDMRNGCLCGNIAAEINAHAEEVRVKIGNVFSTDKEAIAICLGDAVAQGELSDQVDVDELAGFIMSSLQGAFLVSKVDRNPESVQRFKRTLFSITLAPWRLSKKLQA